MPRYNWFFAAVIVASTFGAAAAAEDGPKNSVVLIIRHAEDAESGNGISPLGQQRAQAYKDYFLNFSVDSKPMQPNVIYAAKDSKRSHRPHLTVVPFAEAAKLPVDTRFGNTQSTELAADLRANDRGKVFLICWRHKNIPALLTALGAKPKSFLPKGKWPGSVYDWVILLGYDEDGRLNRMSSRRINEHLLPGDAK